MHAHGSTRGTARDAARANRRRARLVRTLQSAGVLPDPAWRAAFADVPRHVFLDRFFRQSDGRWVAVDDTDPAWLDLVYADNVLATQLDDDPTAWARARETGPIPGVPTSSSSQPAIMAVMLEMLQVADGQRVLEIGTGTGYNAGLLSHRLGDGNVFSVDIDPGLVAKAKERLARCGYSPTCVATDGAEGYPPGAPYDRVLATCAVASIPVPWLEQTVPGGLVVTTLHRPLGNGLVRITAGEDGTGQGRVLPMGGRFMPLRAHRVARPADPDPTTGQVRSTELNADILVSPRSRFDFYASLVLPEAAANQDTDGSVWLIDSDGSWARHTRVQGRCQVWQGGPRLVWDVLEAAHDEWLALGSPPRDRFGLTVGPDRQEFWLDDPDSEHRWPL